MELKNTAAPSWQALSERLKEVRRVSGLSQTDFAAFIGVSQSYVSAVERLDSKPSIELILGVGEKLNWVSRTWLLTGEGTLSARNLDSPDTHLDAEYVGAESVADVEAAEAVVGAIKIYEAFSCEKISRKSRQKLFIELMRRYAALSASEHQQKKTPNEEKMTSSDWLVHELAKYALNLATGLTVKFA